MDGSEVHGDYGRVQRSIDFVESNLSKRIGLEEMAGEACWSPYHFSRVFQAITGRAPVEYIRRRRMDTAAYRLLFTKEPILDLAVGIGYESQAAFTRAFKRTFGATPGEYRRRGSYVMTCERIDVERTIGQRQGEVFMEARVVDLGEMSVMGPVLQTKNDGSNNIQIPQFWERFLSEKTAEAIPGKTNPGRNYGICGEFKDDGSFSYLIGHDVDKDTVPPKGLKLWKIPSRTYALFTAKGAFPEAIQEMWKAIYSQWFPTNGTWERAEGEDFEVYEESRMEPGKGECDIYIPVKRKD
jgi:AraC family transcriptional regulator